MTAVWKRRFNELFPTHATPDTADTNDTTIPATRPDGVLSVVSALSNGAGVQIAEEVAPLSVNCVCCVTGDKEEIEAGERDAITREAELAVRQTIPQAQMVAGLLKVARWPR